MNEAVLALAHSLTTDPYPTPDYQIIRTPYDLISYLYSGPPDYHRITLAEDTESTPDVAPYCLTFSVRPGTGRLIYTRDTELLSRYHDFLISWHTDIHHLFHNYLHDITVFSRLSLPVHRFTDTMVRAYNLCLGGGGDDEDSESRAGRGLLSLKVLAWRHCQMRMTSFQDTVHPHSLPHAIAWLESAREMLAPLPPAKYCDCGHVREDHIPRGKTGKLMGQCKRCQCAKYKLGKKQKTGDAGEEKHLVGLHRKINTLLNAVQTRETDPDSGEPVNPWKRYDGWNPEDWEVLEPVLGLIPRPSIAHVPEHELLMYACRDSDATLRLYQYMRHLQPWIFYQR